MLGKRHLQESSKWEKKPLLPIDPPLHYYDEGNMDLILTPCLLLVSGSALSISTNKYPFCTQKFADLTILMYRLSLTCIFGFLVILHNQGKKVFFLITQIFMVYMFS